MNIKENKITLLSWHAKNNGLGVLLNTLNLLSDKGIEIEQIIYLVQDKSDIPNKKEIPDKVKCISVVVQLDDPTFHEEIFEKIKALVLPKIKNISELHINISSGTPAMHAVWLIMHAHHLFPKGTQIWSSQLVKNNENIFTIKSVNLFLNTYLDLVKEWDEKNPEKARYNIDAKTQKREGVLQLVCDYAKIPFVPILITGERGVGKTRLVESIIAEIKKKEVVRLHCEGLKDEFAEKIFFGWTNEGIYHKGLLELSNNKLLFLDEVQGLSMKIQQLLSTIFRGDSQSFREISSLDIKELKVELVCSSSRSLSEIREKLDVSFFDCLTHFVVTLPALRDCPDDIEEDWKKLWIESTMVSDARFEHIPWSESIAKALKKDALYGNFRDMQCLIAFIKAFWIENRQKEGIEIAINKWKERQEEFSSSDQNTNEFGSGDYKDRVIWFRQKLTQWALKINENQWEKAAKFLNVSEKTLRINLQEMNAQNQS